MNRFNEVIDRLIQEDGVNVTVSVKLPPETIMQIGLTALIVMACGKIIGIGISKLLE